MNNDLISREALKKELAKCGYDIADFGSLFLIIDNAPTVEAPNEVPIIRTNIPLESEQIEKLKKIIEKQMRSDKCVIVPNYCEIINPAKRLKGEWMYNDYGNGCGNWHCSKCDHIPYYATKYMRFLNFCPNCGADMRGEDNG